METRDGNGDGDSMCKQAFKVCSHLMSAFAFVSTSPSKFNIASMVTQTQNAQNGSEPILCINVNLTVTLMQTQKQTSSVNKALTYLYNLHV